MSTTAKQIISRFTIRQCILAKVRTRGLEKTICPSEVARELGGEEWRSLMSEVRMVGIELAKSGEIQITQGGKAINPLNIKGPIRLRVTEKGLKQER
ncbi:DUF3253 domain-containing protein [Leptothermofonsia sp. ETS-13]|uniref:DUF3253 domain-containing protein n=1 Tax=Leptothermofonsia sp. ETS-13 TaxID=3035696 RepID=UPI003BA1AD70